MATTVVLIFGMMVKTVISYGLIVGSYHDHNCTIFNIPEYKYYKEGKCIPTYGAGSFKVKCSETGYSETRCLSNDCSGTLGSTCFEYQLEFGCDGKGNYQLCGDEPKLGKYGFYFEYFHHQGCGGSYVYREYYMNGGECHPDDFHKSICKDGDFYYGYFANSSCGGELQRTSSWLGPFCSKWAKYSWGFACP